MIVFQPKLIKDNICKCFIIVKYFNINITNMLTYLLLAILSNTIVLEVFYTRNFTVQIMLDMMLDHFI